MTFFRRHRGKLLLLLLALGLAGWFAHVHRADLTREHLLAYGKSIHAGGFMAAFLILPLVGFPVSIFLVLAGIRFGLYGGMATAAVAVIFHHVAVFRITHGWLRDPVRHRLERAGHAIPPIRARHRAWFTALFAALHGPPYIAKLYLLALTDIPFRIYLWVGAPVYVLFCLIPVGAGTALKHFNPTWLYLIIGLSSLLLATGYWLRRKLVGKNPPAPPQE